MSIWIATSKPIYFEKRPVALTLLGAKYKLLLAYTCSGDNEVFIRIVNVIQARCSSTILYVHIRSLISCGSLMNSLLFLIRTDYIFFLNRKLPTSTHLCLLPLGIVVEVYPYQVLPADCPLLIILRI